MDIGWASRQLSHAHSQLELHRINVLWEKKLSVILLCLCREAKPKKTQKAKHHSPHTHSSEYLTPKAQSKIQKPNPQTTINEQRMRKKNIK